MIEILKFIKLYLQLMLGQTAKTVVRPGQAYTGSYMMLQAITDCTVVSISDNQLQEGAWQTDDTITAGTVIFGDFSQIEISAGLLVAYHKIV